MFSLVLTCRVCVALSSLSYNCLVCVCVCAFVLSSLHCLVFVILLSLSILFRLCLVQIRPCPCPCPCLVPVLVLILALACLILFELVSCLGLWSVGKYTVLSSYISSWPSVSDRPVLVITLSCRDVRLPGMLYLFTNQQWILNCAPSPLSSFVCAVFIIWCLCPLPSVWSFFSLFACLLPCLCLYCPSSCVFVLPSSLSCCFPLGIRPKCRDDGNSIWRAVKMMDSCLQHKILWASNNTFLPTRCVPAFRCLSLLFISSVATSRAGLALCPICLLDLFWLGLSDLVVSRLACFRLLLNHQFSPHFGELFFLILSWLCILRLA